MLFGVANLKIDKKIETKFVGVKEMEYPIEGKGTTKIKKEPIPIYKINIEGKELFITIVAGRDIPMLYIASDFDLLLKQINQLERELRGEGD